MHCADPIGLVLDTNVVLDWLVFDDPCTRTIADAIRSGRARWWVCPSVMAEMDAVLARQLPDRWEPARKHALTAPWRPLVAACADPPSPAQPDLRCRDRDDQKFVDLAMAQSARVLLSRDRALLALARPAARAGLEILTPQRFTSAPPADP
ncbi:MAG: PIN domain-containing protein [Burkholderiaceae bacterium]